MVGAVCHSTHSGSILRRLVVTDLAQIALRSSEEGVGSINSSSVLIMQCMPNGGLPREVIYSLFPTLLENRA
jgi:hypothetical protein